MLYLLKKIFIALLILNTQLSAGIIEKNQWEKMNFEGRDAFIIMPKKHAQSNIPWVMYAPTLTGLPNERDEGWMIDKFLEAGIAISGINIGESYGNPEGRKTYTKFHDFLTKKKNFNQKASLLARSRGGLMLYNWAIENPEKVKCIAGIYPVCNLSSYPGLNRAAPAYKMSEGELVKNLSLHNPIENLKPLAQANIPIFHIHGNVDEVVPLKLNSGIISKRYEMLGGKMQLIVPEGQGHNMWQGFFKCAKLVEFVINCSKDNLTSDR